MGNTNSWWGENGNDLMQLALMYWANQGRNGDTPNFYNVPLTPEQKRWDDARWQMFQNGGSDATKFVRGAGAQFIGSMPTGPTNHSFLSPLMQGQTFAGGITPPKIDISKLPPMGTQQSGGPTRPTPTGPGAGVYPGPGGQPTSDTIRSPWAIGGGGPHGGQPPARTEMDMGGDTTGTGRYGETIADYYQRTNAGARETEQGFEDRRRNDANANPSGPMGNGGGIPPDVAANAYSWWQKYKAEHPNWARLGVNAAVTGLAAVLGPYGALAGKLIGSFLLRDQTPPPSGAAPTGGNQ